MSGHQDLDDALHVNANDIVCMGAAPRWLLVDVQVLRKTRNLTLTELRGDPELQDLLVLKKGNRLSITPVTPTHWKSVLKRLA